MDVAEHGAASGDTAVVGTGAARVRARRDWAVVNLDREHQQLVLLTRWRWYATWWAASLRIFDGDDVKIVRTS